MLFSGTAYFSHSVAWHVSASKVSNGCRDFFLLRLHTEKAPFLQTAKSDTPFTAHILCAKVISGVLDIFKSPLFQGFISSKVYLSGLWFCNTIAAAFREEARAKVS